MAQCNSITKLKAKLANSLKIRKKRITIFKQIRNPIKRYMAVLILGFIQATVFALFCPIGKLK